MKISKYVLGSNIPGNVFSLPFHTKETAGFPEDYKFAKGNWGGIYYKVFDKENYFEAVKQCQQDGGTLPIPRSGMVYLLSKNFCFPILYD